MVVLTLLLDQENNMNTKRERTHTHKEWLLKQAYFQKNLGNYQRAIELLQEYSTYKINKEAILTLARCYQLVGKFEMAIASYHLIPNWYNDLQILIHIARTYEEFAKKSPSEKKEELLLKSLNTYLQIPNWDTNRNVLLSLAPCYRELGWFESALWAYQQITPGSNHWQNISIQNIINNLQQLISIQQEQTNQITQYINELFQQAYYYQMNNQYELALMLYEQTPDQYKHINCFAHQALLYEAVERYSEAAYLFQYIYNCTGDPTAIMALNRCHKMLTSTTMPPSVTQVSLFNSIDYNQRSTGEDNDINIAWMV